MNFKLALLLVSVLVSDISCDTCDTYKHPTYGLGKCIATSLCPNQNYISNLCESKPAAIKCCFSANSAPTTGLSCKVGQKLTHATAFSHVKIAGITTSSSGACSDPKNKKCTSLEQITCKAIVEIIAYKKASACTTIITGGTEIGHSGGLKSHGTGYKIDIALSSCHRAYILKNFVNAGKRSDGAQLYKDPRGNTWALESNHWDILFP